LQPAFCNNLQDLSFSPAKLMLGHAWLMVGARHLVVDWVSAGSSKDPELLLELFAGGEHWFRIKISSTSLLYTFKRYYCQA